MQNDKVTQPRVYFRKFPVTNELENQINKFNQPFLMSQLKNGVVEY